MGGSGGSYLPNRLTPEEMARRVRQAEDSARDDAFETEVSGFLGSLLTDFNERDVNGTQEVLHQVINDIESEIEGTVDTLFGGSISKHTYVDGISDIDALVLLDKSELANESAEEARSFLADLLRDRFGDEAVSEGHWAVTIDLHDKTIQLLPALRDGDRVKIVSSDGQNWSKVNPQGFANALTNANRNMNGQLVPCIKLIKAIVATLPEKRQITGYHTESIAIKVFSEYNGQKTPKAMLKHFFSSAPEHIIQPIRDRSGQSVNVDDYLGKQNSLDRRIVADTLGRIGRKIRNADGAQALDRWADLFERE